ncbi:DUF2231 domain-containing protein [Qipengyuania vulgaris]|uniref:DUF2231 domain-containing protein n=1 Tax=Qipengyuania vulgaris TaxID=291985 RepID=UPI00301E05A8
MNSVLRLFACLVLLLSPTASFAHGNEKYGEEETRPTASEAVHTQPGHDMAVAVNEATSSATPEDHDDGQVESEGITGVLKSLHPATVHFPVALFLMAALTELFVMTRRTPEHEAAVRIMIYGGAAGGVLAALFGWIHTGLWFGGDTVMQVHRWNGMLISVLGMAAAWIAYRPSRSRAALRFLLFPIAALLIVQGFMGGELAHGLNHLKL